MRLAITHETLYEYGIDVEQAHHVAMLTPLNTPRQTVFSHGISVSPEPTSRNESQDAFGQTRTYFEIASPHRELRVTATSEVSTTPLPAAQQGKLDRVALPASAAWQSVASAMQFAAGKPFDPACEFVQPTTLAPSEETFRGYVRDLASDDVSVFRLASLICQRIYRDFEYAPAATDVNTLPQTALKLKRGVCQDFAQVAIACFRSLGLPAKYVSGYLLTEPPPGQPRLIGADASHAWLSVYSPDYGWLELDPTNNCLVGEGHVVVAYGGDYNDVPPLRGVIRGGGAHELKVSVTVMPI